MLQPIKSEAIWCNLLIVTFSFVSTSVLIVHAVSRISSILAEHDSGTSKNFTRETSSPFAVDLKGSSVVHGFDPRQTIILPFATSGLCRPSARRRFPHCDASRKVAVQFTVVQDRPRINFRCGTFCLVGRLVDDDVDEGHVGDVLPIASVQLGLIDF